ncbi:J-domain-containing protein [Brachybacterium sp. AOP35-5H-19]|uniref:J-domain-containing protein n=1 Tax=Brachybacterium sp. AOP35-5H-19 TaxID=3457685 RepID=UPI0040344D17
MMAPDVARVESAIEQAARRGDFDNLPGAGKPLNLPATHDPDWWINQRLASGEIDSQALLPVVVLLRKEFEQREETLAALPTAQAAREYAEDFTQRVHQDRRANPFQRMLAPAWDPDDAAQRWRELRAAAPTSVAEPTAPQESVAEPRRRRWWQPRRRRWWQPRRRG